MKNQPTVVITADGSKTLYCPHYRQTYHSRYGALTESQHVFINASDMAQKMSGGRAVTVLEIGFGTGLNFLLSASLAIKMQAQLHYTALEKNRLPTSLLQQLDYGYLLHNDELFNQLLSYFELHTATDKKLLPELNGEHFSLQLLLTTDALQTLAEPQFDIIFLDAFSPDTNSELWHKDILSALYSNLRPSGVLTTYCVKGSVKRTLKECGFVSTRLPGPPGKREMLKCKKSVCA